MKRLIAPALAVAALAAPAAAGAKPAPDPVKGAPIDLAIIGDAPYGPDKLAVAPDNIAQINEDPTVVGVVHLGDIKNGSSRCDTDYFNLIRQGFDTFEDPLVYTPGDNEWTDCHRANNGGYQPAGPRLDGAPLTTPGPSRLDELRRIFFNRPGQSLGRHPIPLDYQSQLVENVQWFGSGAQFGDLNVPGSNNDALPWFGAAESDALKRLQRDEVDSRTAYDVEWIRSIFRNAKRNGAKGVAIGIQADMWDPAIVNDPTQYSAFTPIVTQLAKSARRFGGPVMLLNGDSHMFSADKPLGDANGKNNTIYGIPYAVPNLSRVTVDGSSNFNDYLKLHVDPKAAGVFSFTRVPFRKTAP